MPSTSFHRYPEVSLTCAFAPESPQQAGLLLALRCTYTWHCQAGIMLILIMY
jgi:hypothetical protein